MAVYREVTFTSETVDLFHAVSIAGHEKNQGGTRHLSGFLFADTVQEVVDECRLLARKFFPESEGYESWTVHVTKINHATYHEIFNLRPKTDVGGS